MESYEELRQAMGREIHIALKHCKTKATESYGELRRAMGVTESNCFFILIIFVHDHSGDMKNYGEVRRAMKSYGEPWVEKFILYLNMNRQEPRRATESYGELWRAMERYRDL